MANQRQQPIGGSLPVPIYWWQLIIIPSMPLALQHQLYISSSTISVDYSKLLAEFPKVLNASKKLP